MTDETKAKQKSFFVGYNVAKKKYAMGRRNDKPITTMTLLEQIQILEEDLKHKKIAIKSRKARIKELESQIEKMRCCGNCRFSESDKLNGTFCHREGCFVIASEKCKLWDN